MRVHNRKRNMIGRKVIALLLLCGLLLPIMPQTEAASVRYEYKWIKTTTGLPKDKQWHNYFIAWEDTDDDKKVWFTDYHWYTADGYNNYDAGGTHWMEYKAASTLPNSTSSRFTSQESLGHMQIKYAGKDTDNDDSPMYYIRVSKMNGGYMYFTEYEPSSDEEDAEAFTFQDKGDVFHIFVNIGGKADRYLTRDGQYLETTESSSYGGGEYWRPLRVYQEIFSVDEDEQFDDVIGKTTLYEYTWVNTAEKLLAAANSKQWNDILLAWEDADGGGTSKPDTVWYTKEIWQDENGNYNYENDGDEFFYWSNDTLGSDGYSSAYADTFTLPYKVSHFQMKQVGWDEDNPIDGYTNAEGEQQDSPIFHFRFDVGHKKYIYIDNDQFTENSDDAADYTVQLRLGKQNSEDPYGSVHIFVNRGWGSSDEYLTRKGNRLDVSFYWYSKVWEFPFRLYTCREVEYEAIVQSFTVGKGTTYTIAQPLIIDEGVTITVENGGVLVVNKPLLNSGKIVVKNGGTVIVNEGGHIMSYNNMSYDNNALGEIILNGGNMIIMDGAKVICDQVGGNLLAENGATILNRGLLMVGNALIMNKNAVLKNESNAMLLVGGRVAEGRSSIDEFTVDEIVSCVENKTFGYLLSKHAKIINKGVISEHDEPEKVTIKYSTDAQANINHVGNGRVDKRKT